MSKQYIKKKRVFKKSFLTATIYNQEVLRAFSKTSFLKTDKRKTKRRMRKMLSCGPMRFIIQGASNE